VLDISSQEARHIVAGKKKRVSAITSRKKKELVHKRWQAKKAAQIREIDDIDEIDCWSESTSTRSTKRRRYCCCCCCFVVVVVAEKCTSNDEQRMPTMGQQK